jgi:predicted dehydrogenase
MATKKEVVNVGVVGCGFATSTFHAPLLQATPGIKLVAISSSDTNKVKQLYGDSVIALGSVDELFAMKEIDLVVIPTPNETHYPLAAKALAAGKHVVIDKPFTLNVKEAEDLVSKAKEAKRTLSVFHNRRWDSDFLTLRQVLSEGKLGRLVQVESHFDRYRPEVRSRWREVDGPGAGLWYDLAPHVLDQMIVLFGNPSSIIADIAKTRTGSLAPDWFHGILEWTNGLRAIVHVTALSAWQAPRWQVHGTTGTFVCWGLDCQEDQIKSGKKPGEDGFACESKPAAIFLGDGTDRTKVQEVSVPRLNGNYLNYYAALRDCLLHGSPNPVPPEEALFVMRLMEAGEMSAKEGRKIHVNLKT